MNRINLAEKFLLFSEYWSPKIVGELNGQHVKQAKFKGAFVWHKHDHENELFFVLKGILKIEFRDRTETLQPGEMLIKPCGVEHKPVEEDEVEVMVFEPASTRNTGNVESELTKEKLDWI